MKPAAFKSALESRSASIAMAESTGHADEFPPYVPGTTLLAKSAALPSMPVIAPPLAAARWLGSCGSRLGRSSASSDEGLPRTTWPGTLVGVVVAPPDLFPLARRCAAPTAPSALVLPALLPGLLPHNPETLFAQRCRRFGPVEPQRCPLPPFEPGRVTAVFEPAVVMAGFVAPAVPEGLVVPREGTVVEGMRWRCR